VRSPSRTVLAVVFAVLLVGGIVATLRTVSAADRTHIVGYFDNSNDIYTGDDVVILGVPVGKIEKIEPQPTRVKISFWFDSKFKVPADAKAVILSPSLVTVRAIQLAPAYTGGAQMPNDSVIPRERTAVPVEYDDLRQQLQKLTDTLQPTEPGGVSTLGAFINTAADNLRGQGSNIRETIINLSEALNTVGNNNGDLFATFKNLATLVSALHDSTDVLKSLNQNLAGVTGLLSNDPDEIGGAVRDLSDVAADLKTFVADNRDTVSTTSEKLASVSTAVTQSLGDIKQTLHIAPTAFQNFINIYQPAQATFSGALAINNFANPLQFLCSAVQAASRLGAQQSAKLCVQYLAPIFKNRQYNFPPLGENLIVGASARPNEITYSEDWMRPDYIPPPGSAPPASAAAGPLAAESPTAAPLPAETPAAGPAPGDAPGPPAPTPTNPADGLQGIMVPPGGGQ
jgi:phospholipid/cholesterol/gamma-HCH transport system substrate-binding protein